VSWPATRATLHGGTEAPGPRDEALRLRNNDDAGTAITGASLSDL